MHCQGQMGHLAQVPRASWVCPQKYRGTVFWQRNESDSGPTKRQENYCSMQVARNHARLLGGYWVAIGWATGWLLHGCAIGATGVATGATGRPSILGYCGYWAYPLRSTGSCNTTNAHDTNATNPQILALANQPARHIIAPANQTAAPASPLP